MTNKKLKICYFAYQMFLDFKFIPIMTHTAFTWIVLGLLFEGEVLILPMGAIYAITVNYFVKIFLDKFHLLEKFKQIEEERQPLTIERVKKLGKNFLIAFTCFSVAMSLYLLWELPRLNTEWIALGFLILTGVCVPIIFGCIQIILKPEKYYKKWTETGENI